MWMFMTCLAIVRSRFSLWSSLTMKIMSKRERIVVWKSMFCSDHRRRGEGTVRRHNRRDRFGAVPHLSRRLHVVVSSPNRVGGSEDARARVQNSCDAGLGDRDGLLFHRLVNCDPVLVAHLIELVNADDARVGQNHRAALKEELSLRTRRQAIRNSPSALARHAENEDAPSPDRAGRSPSDRQRTIPYPKCRPRWAPPSRRT